MTDDIPGGEPKRGIFQRFFPDPLLGGAGLLASLIALVVYVRTVAPTVSFWDCGEFITCSHILGIPHPPGTPLYVLIGRIFALLPTASDPSLRINLFSSVSLAAATGVAFFVLARLISSWFSDKYPDVALPFAQRLTIAAGAFCGSLFMAFASTNWSNAVEAEVYGFSMFLMLLLMWLGLAWAQHREERAGDRYLVAMAYIALLSVGVHMTVFLVMPPLFLMILILSPKWRRDPRFYITGVTLFMVTVGVLDFLWAAPTWLVITGLFTLATKGDSRRRWELMFMVMLVALLGFSTHIFLPIRSQHDPAIDQNDPETFSAFQDFLDRKQYGEQSMFQRALVRRAEWSNQLGQHRRMGFWGFFDRQYGFNDALFLPIFALGLFGVGYMIRKRKAYGALFLTALLISSLGLVWYMNFADGTKYNPATDDAYLEVRDRDYFFTPAFILFGMAIGLGGAALVRFIGGGSRTWSIAGSVVIAIMPARALLANYHINDRSNNYIAYDYAYNILNSADPNAVLFTNGDNDTFPVWCLQEVYGIRKDVRVANLSLLNTPWYIRQLRDKMNVPMRLSDRDINSLIHYRLPDNSIRRIQDQMVDEILTANRWEQNINFAVTVSANSRTYQQRPLDDHLVMSGLVYRLVRDSLPNRVDLDRMKDLVLNEFKFRGLNDDAVYKDENTMRMIGNFTSTFLMITDTLRRAGRFEEAEHYALRSLDYLPDESEAYLYLTTMYADAGRKDRLDSLAARLQSSKADRDRVESAIAYSYRRVGDTTAALNMLNRVLKRSPDNEPAYRTMVQFYYEAGEYDTLLAFMQDWTTRHPDDQRSRDLQTQVQNLITRLRQSAVPDTQSSTATP